MNPAILQAILAGLPALEQIILLFVHNKESQQKYTTVIGAVNDVAPIAVGIAAGLAAPAAATATPSVTTTGH